MTAETGTTAAPGARLPFWQARPCPSWCETAGGHDDGDPAADRVHVGPAGFVRLALEDAATFRAGGLTWTEAPVLAVVLLQGEGDRGPHVALWHRDDRVMRLTVAEAEQLAAALGVIITAARAAAAGGES